MTTLVLPALLAVGAVIWLVVAELRYPHGQWQAYLERRRGWAALALFLERYGDALFDPFGERKVR
jgi:hypothetical protein